MLNTELAFICTRLCRIDQTMGSAIISIILSLVLVYVSWRLIQVLFYYFAEYLVLWIVATGGSEKRRNIAARMRLHVYVCPTDYLDESSVVELFKFLNNHLDSSVDIQGFHKVLLSYSYAVLFRERRDGSLRGIFLMALDRVKKDGKSYTVLRPGLSFFEKEYRGGPYIYYVFSYFRIKELLCHPFTPFYILGKAFSYRSYGVLTHNFAHVYPSHNRETPDSIKQIINDVALKVKLPTEVYDPETFVLKREFVSMKNFVSEAGNADTSDPNINYFITINPGWEKGHQLITLSKVEVLDVVRVVYRMLSKAVRGRRRDQGSRKPKLLRRNTFQSDFANMSSKRVFLECDLTGHHHPSETADDSIEDLDELF